MEDLFNFPTVSIITVNLNGRDYLKNLLESLDGIDYPKDRLEIIVVDNGSGDGSVDFLKSSYPGINIIENSYNTGFAVANNQGATPP